MPEQLSDYARRQVGKSSVIACVVGAMVATALTTTFIALKFGPRCIPEFREVQLDYVAPSEITIKCSDQDRDGKPETVMYVKDTPYLLRYDSEGKPELTEYEVRKPRVVLLDRRFEQERGME